MLNFNFSEKDLGLVLHHILFMIFQEKCFSCHNLLTDQISLSDCLTYYLYLGNMCIRIFVNQGVMSYILKLTLSF